VIDYLREEVRILKELNGKKRLRFTDEQRRRLARKAKRIGFGRLKEIVSLVTRSVQKLDYSKTCWFAVSCGGSAE